MTDFDDLLFPMAKPPEIKVNSVDLETGTVHCTVTVYPIRYYHQEDYIQEPLALGWRCRATDCGVWNGDEKEFLLACRSCGGPRPLKDSVPKGARGK